MQTFEVPGAAAAVVSAAGIVHARNFGVRHLASGAPVTPNTIFRIGSTTKSMTALPVATFVDEGLLGWDQRVVGALVGRAIRFMRDELGVPVMELDGLERVGWLSGPP